MPKLAALAAVLVLTAPFAARAESTAADAPPKPAAKSLAILDLEAGDEAAKPPARTTTALLAVSLSSYKGLRVITAEDVRALIGHEKQRALLGCTDSNCLMEISGALGTRYLLQGRYDKLGSRIILTSSVIDALTNKTVVRTKEELTSEDELPAASDRIARKAADALQVSDTSSEVVAPDFQLNFKLGNTLPGLVGTAVKFHALNLRLDLQGDYFIRPFLSAWLQAGLVLGTAQADPDTSAAVSGSFSLVPVAAGLKYTFRSATTVRPYTGLGIGLGILTAFVHPADAGELGLKLNGLAGVLWLPWRSVGFNLEASMDLASLSVTEGTHLLFGFNTNFGVVVLF